MARDYKHAAKSSAKQRPIGSWVSFISGLGIGLFVAACVYVWLSDPTPQNGSASDPVVSDDGYADSDFQEQIDSERPKRKFDFYKILPEIEVRVPNWELSTPPAKQELDIAPGIYVLQVGSFKQHRDADRAKAQLALRGIHAKIHRVVINGQDVWYRVHVGPYTAIDKLRAMRAKLIESGHDFILLKIGDNAG